MENLKKNSVENVKEKDFEEKLKTMMKIIKEGAKKDSRFILFFAGIDGKSADMSAMHYEVNADIVGRVLARALADFVEKTKKLNQDEKPKDVDGE